VFTQTLILNQHYRPHEIVDWKKAMTKMLNGKLEVLVQYDEVMAHIDSHTLDTFPKLKRALRQVIGTDVGTIEVKVPAVAVLTRRLGQMKSGVKFSRPNVCLRDDFRCQYCGDKLPMSKLNYDHVVPRSKGGKTVWENIVTSCYPCNDRKANRTPAEAGMTLLSVPTKPHLLPMRNELRIDPERAPVEWAPYIVKAA
jgi:5-methylcytosine-specific restriction endonuclease McrA